MLSLVVSALSIPTSSPTGRTKALIAENSSLLPQKQQHTSCLEWCKDALGDDEKPALWNTKCSWGGCGGCDECTDTVDPPGVTRHAKTNQLKQHVANVNKTEAGASLVLSSYEEDGDQYTTDLTITSVSDYKFRGSYYVTRSDISYSTARIFCDEEPSCSGFDMDSSSPSTTRFFDITVERVAASGYTAYSVVRAGWNCEFDKIKFYSNTNMRNDADEDEIYEVAGANWENHFVMSDLGSISFADKIKSMRVPPGCWVRAYQDSDYGGDSLSGKYTDILADVYTFCSDWSATMSSLVVLPYDANTIDRVHFMDKEGSNDGSDQGVFDCKCCCAFWGPGYYFDSMQSPGSFTTTDGSSQSADGKSGISKTVGNDNFGVVRVYQGAVAEMFNAPSLVGEASMILYAGSYSAERYGQDNNNMLQLGYDSTSMMYTSSIRVMPTAGLSYGHGWVARGMWEAVATVDISDPEPVWPEMEFGYSINEESAQTNERQEVKSIEQTVSHSTEVGHGSLSFEYGYEDGAGSEETMGHSMTSATSNSLSDSMTCPAACQVWPGETEPVTKGERIPTTNWVGYNCPRGDTAFKSVLGWCKDNDKTLDGEYRTADDCALAVRADSECQGEQFSYGTIGSSLEQQCRCDKEAGCPTGVYDDGLGEIHRHEFNYKNGSKMYIWRWSMDMVRQFDQTSSVTLESCHTQCTCGPQRPACALHDCGDEFCTTCRNTDDGTAAKKKKRQANKNAFRTNKQLLQLHSAAPFYPHKAKSNRLKNKHTAVANKAAVALSAVAPVHRAKPVHSREGSVHSAVKFAARLPKARTQQQATEGKEKEKPGAMRQKKSRIVGGIRHSELQEAHKTPGHRFYKGGVKRFSARRKNPRLGAAAVQRMQAKATAETAKIEKLRAVQAKKAMARTAKNATSLYAYPGSKGVKFYDRKDYASKGWSTSTIGAGKYDDRDFKNLGIKNDGASSVKVDADCCVTLYNKNNWEKELGETCSDVSNFKDKGWNDKMSSFQVMCVEEVAPPAADSGGSLVNSDADNSDEDTGYDSGSHAADTGGTCDCSKIEFYAGTYFKSTMWTPFNEHCEEISNLADGYEDGTGVSPNNNIESIKIPIGCHLRIWETDAFMGYYSDLLHDVPYLCSDWQNTIEAIQIYAYDPETVANVLLMDTDGGNFYGNCYNIFAPTGELFGENNPPDHASLGTTLEDNLKAMRVYPGAMAQLFEDDEMRGRVMWFYPGTYSYQFYGSNNVAQLPEPFNMLSSIRILNAVGSDAWTDVQGSWEEFGTISKTDTDPVWPEVRYGYESAKEQSEESSSFYEESLSHSVWMTTTFEVDYGPWSDFTFKYENSQQTDSSSSESSGVIMSEAAGQSIDQEVTCPLTCQIPAAETSPEEEGAKMPTTDPIGKHCPKYEDVYKGIGWCTDSDGNQQYKRLYGGCVGSCETQESDGADKGDTHEEAIERCFYSAEYSDDCFKDSLGGTRISLGVYNEDTGGKEGVCFCDLIENCHYVTEDDAYWATSYERYWRDYNFEYQKMSIWLWKMEATRPWDPADTATITSCHTQCTCSSAPPKCILGACADPFCTKCMNSTST